MKIIKRQKLRSIPKKRILGLVSLTLVSLGLFAGITFAEVKMPEIFGDQMVLQEETAIVWGEADPAEKITVTYDGVTAIGEAGQEGKWKVELNGLKSSEVGKPLRISGNNTHLRRISQALGIHSTETCQARI